MAPRILLAFTVVIGLGFAGTRGDGLQPQPSSVQKKYPDKSAKQPPARSEKLPPLSRAEVDKAASRAAYNAIKLGIELWKNENYEGTFRLYQGTLIGLEGMLDHHPELVKEIRERLDVVKTMTPEEGAFQLRTVLDRLQLVTMGSSVSPRKPLWDRLGGEKNVKLIVHDLLAAAIKDPKVNFSRGGKYKPGDKLVARIEEHMVELFSEFVRGPLEYTGRNVIKTHTGMNITGAEFDAFLGHLVNALKKNNVADSDAAELLLEVNGLKDFFIGR